MTETVSAAIGMSAEVWVGGVMAEESQVCRERWKYVYCI